jgi:hypothetical protein
LWLYFSFILSVGAIISFLIHQFSNFNADFLNFEKNIIYVKNYNYKVSIFGLTLVKFFFFVEVERVCSFFNEPQFAGLYFLFNILLLKKINNNSIPRKFLVVNILAGILTFSITFYLVFAMLLFFSLIRYVIFILACLFLFILLIFIILYKPDIFNYFFIFIFDNTSLLDRIERSNNSIIILRELSFLNLFFGNGINSYSFLQEDPTIASISSGYQNILFDFGFLFLCFFLIILISFLKKNPTLTLVCMLYLFVLPIYYYYYVWYAIILYSLTYENNIARKYPHSNNIFLK